MPHNNAKPRPPRIRKLSRLRAMWYALFNPNKLVNATMQRVINNDFGLRVPFEVLGKAAHTWHERWDIFKGCWFHYQKYIAYMEQCTHDAYMNRFVIRPLTVYMDSELSDDHTVD